MFDISTSTWKFDQPLLWVELVLSIIVIGFTLFFFYKTMKRKLVIGFLTGFGIVSLASWFLNLTFLWVLSLQIFIAVVIVASMVNLPTMRPFFANSLAGKLSFGKSKETEKVFDRHATYVKVASAVEYLSKNKTGAIITFERNSKLTDYIKTGTVINSPITPELLITIFYPGTRLHDGAVVIRRDIMLAASVYYTPTTKPLTGKFGSRHRAAIGISEVTDSVTVVVSEETGRISLAVNGELIPVTVDSFLRTFEDCMAEEKAENEEI